MQFIADEDMLINIYEYFFLTECGMHFYVMFIINSLVSHF